MRVLIIEPPALGAVGYWRLYQPLQAMRQSFNNFDFDVKQDFKEGELMMYDWLILARPSKPIEMEMIATAKKLGVKVAVDYDDDLFNIPIMHPAFDTFNDPERKQVIATAAVTADVLWCSTQSIKDSIGLDKAIVIPNAIPLYWLPEKPAPITKSAGWRGQPTQYTDVVLQGWASGWYDRIKDMPDMWHWMGWKPWPLSPGTQHKVEKGTSIVKYLDYVKNAGINLMWKPLLPSVFNDGKSNIAWLEATMGGGACVTNYAGKPGWETCLADFDFTESVIHDAWRASREKVVKDHDLYEQACVRYACLCE